MGIFLPAIIFGQADRNGTEPKREKKGKEIKKYFLT